MVYTPAFPADGAIETGGTNEAMWTLLEQWRAATQMCLGGALGSLQSITLDASGFIGGFTQAAVELHAYSGTLDELEGINAGDIPAGFILAMKPVSGHAIIVKHASASAAQAQKIYLTGNVDWTPGMYGLYRQWLIVIFMGATKGWYELDRHFGTDLDAFRSFYSLLSSSGGTITGNLNLAGNYTILDWNVNPVTLLSTDHALSLIGVTGNLAFGTHEDLPAVQGRTAVSLASDIHLQPHGGDVIINDETTGGKAWHAGNDGAGSGLDADLLDGREMVALVDPPYIELAEAQESGADAAQSLTQTTWTKRNINTEVFDTGSKCSIALSVITLAAGTYRCEIVCPVAGETGVHRARLRNTTAGTTLLSSTNSSGDAPAIIQGRFTLGAESTLEIQHYVSGAAVTTGGELTNGEDEIYTTATFTYLS